MIFYYYPDFIQSDDFFLLFLIKLICANSKQFYFLTKKNKLQNTISKQ